MMFSKYTKIVDSSKIDVESNNVLPTRSCINVLNRNNYEIFQQIFLVAYESLLQILIRLLFIFLGSHILLLTDIINAK